MGYTTVIPSIIQGISQQNPVLRRGSQVEDLYDAVNSPVNGVIPRNGFEYKNYLRGLNCTTAFVYGIFRTKDEQYIVTVQNAKLAIYRADTGEQCKVYSSDSADRYLKSSKLPREAFRAVTIEDVTYLLNNEIKPEMMGGSETGLRPKEAVFYFKAGSYKTSYVIAIKMKDADFIYKWRYETPDNSSAESRPYIASDALAATFHRAMTKGDSQSGTEVTVYGYAAESQADRTGTTKNTSERLIGGTMPGSTGTANTAQSASGYITYWTPNSAVATDLTANAVSIYDLGFQSELNGNVFRIWRTDNRDFDVDVADGSGGTQLFGFKGWTANFADLPRSCFPGVVLKVRGAKDSTADDYWVRWSGGVGSEATWAECPAPGTKTSIDPATMPHRLINTAPNEFTFGPAPWTDRGCGDGILSAEDPSFIGSTCSDLAYDQRRLAIVHEGGVVWSKTSRPHTWFRDTIKTVLATDPIDYKLSHTRPTSYEKFVKAQGTTMIWAQNAQFTISSGDQQGFKESTVEAKALTNYEFSHQVDPFPISNMLAFSSDSGNYVQIRSLTLQGTKLSGENFLTEHVPALIEGDMRSWSWSDLSTSAVSVTSNNKSLLYLYQWRFGQDGTLALSSWSKWRTPVGLTPGWVYHDSLSLLALMYDGLGSYLVSISLDEYAKDDTPGAKYLTRLDLSVPDARCVVAGNSIILPYNVARGDPRVVITSGLSRGRVLTPKSVIPGLFNTVMTFDSLGCLQEENTMTLLSGVNRLQDPPSSYDLGTALPPGPTNMTIQMNIPDGVFATVKVMGRVTTEAPWEELASVTDNAVRVLYATPYVTAYVSSYTGAGEVSAYVSNQKVSFVAGLPISTELVPGVLWPRDPKTGDVILSADPPDLTRLEVHCGPTAYSKLTSQVQLGGSPEEDADELEGSLAIVGLDDGGVVQRSGVLAIPVGAKPDQVNLRIINDTPFPSSWIGLRYEHS